jgi:oligosaccharide repeat unit polymerase
MIVYMRTGGFFNPISFMFLYFYGLLFASSVGALGIPPPSNLGISVFLLSFFFAMIGVVCAKKKEYVPTDRAFRQTSMFLSFFVVVFCFLPFFYLFVSNIGQIYNSGYGAYVSKVRFEDGSISVTGSVILTSVIERISRPMAVSATIIGVALYFKSGHRFLAFLGVFSLLMFSFLYVKRIDLMVLFVVFVSAFVSVNSGSDIGVGKHRGGKFKALFSIFVFSLIIIFISSFRAGSYSIFDILLWYGLGYHTYGIMLFDYALNSPSSSVHDLVFPGQTTFATIDFIISQISGVLGHLWSHVSSSLYSEELGKHIFFGNSDFGGKAVAPNAFYTSLYPLYRDGGYFGVVIGSFTYGYLFSREFLTYKSHRNLRSLVWIIFFAWLGYASLLTPVIMGSTFWFIPLSIYLVFKIRFLFARSL